MNEGNWDMFKEGAKPATRNASRRGKSSTAGLEENCKRLGKFYMIIGALGAVAYFALMVINREGMFMATVFSCAYILVVAPLSFILIGIGEILTKIRMIEENIKEKQR